MFCLEFIIVYLLPEHRTKWKPCAVALPAFKYGQPSVKLQSEIRLKVMRLISEKPEMSSRKVADAVGISNGSAYYVSNCTGRERAGKT